MRKRWISMCIAWTVMTLFVGFLGVWRIHAHPLPDVPSELRAAKLGLGIGALTATGYAAFWLILALTAKKKTHASSGRDRGADAPRSPG